MELIAENICKSIKRNMILDHINLQLSGGHIYGFVGINGAGKTMLFRALSGLIRIDSGQPDSAQKYRGSSESRNCY